VSFGVKPWGWILAGSFFAGGVYFTIADPGIYIGQIWIAVSLVLAGVYLLMTRRAERADRLRREGLPGLATILGAEQTGAYLNNQPRVKLRLRVEAEGIAPFEVEKTVTVPMIALGRLSVGSPLRVYLDRENREGFMIDWGWGPQFE
jgi:hypothetical protein